MIAKVIECSTTKTSLNKLYPHKNYYSWEDSGCLIRSDGPTMIYLPFKIINLATRIGVSNLKYEI